MDNIIIFKFSREDQIFDLKSDLASKTQELNELQNNIGRLDHQLRATVDQKLNVSDWPASLFWFFSLIFFIKEPIRALIATYIVEVLFCNRTCRQRHFFAEMTQN